MFILLIGIVSALFEQEVVELENTHLGKTFLDTVQLAVQGKEPLDRVFQILREQANYYEKEFLSLDEKHKSSQQKCCRDLTDFDNIIQLSKSRLADLQTALDEKLPDKLKKQALLQSKKKDKQNVSNRLEEIQTTRKKQQCMFESRMDEHQIALNAVIAVRKIFENAIADKEASSFVQIEEDDVDKLQALLSYANSKASDFKELQGYTSFFAILEQLQVSQIAKHYDGIVNVVNMCLDFEDYIDQTRTLLRSVDDIREEYFQRLYNSLSKDLRDINVTIDELDSDIQSIEAQVKVFEMDKSELQSKLDTKQKQRVDRLSECDQDDKVYEFKILENQRERETIKRTLDLCMDNVKELKQYVKRRGDQYYKK
ncbi:hypothetical protein pb186bvf_006637 [Paramecium bursaria]